MAARAQAIQDGVITSPTSPSSSTTGKVEDDVNENRDDLSKHGYGVHALWRVLYHEVGVASAALVSLQVYFDFIVF